MFQQAIWACGGMVDTLVLGTSAKAWEFESLHAQIAGYNIGYTPLFLCIERDENPSWEFGGFADVLSIAKFG